MKKYYLLVVGIIFFHIIANIVFLNINPLPEGKDSLAHITAFLNFTKLVQERGQSIFYDPAKTWAGNLMFVVVDYPPLFYATAFFLNSVLGALLYNAALYSATLFFALLIFFTYRIGALWGKETGVISAFICSMYPLVFSSSRCFSLELPLAAMVCLSFWLLWKTDFFKSTKYSLLLGMICGLGMLLKQTFLIYFFGPLVFVFVQMLRNTEKNIRPRIFKNIAGFLGLSLILCGGFYSNPEVFSNIFSRAGFSGAVKEKAWRLQSFIYYPKVLTRVIGWPLTGVFFLGLFSLPRSRKDELRMILLWISAPILVFSFVPLKYGEYLIPVLPAIALASACALSRIRKAVLRGILLTLLAGFLLTDFFAISFGESDFFYSTYFPRAVRIVSSENDDGNRDFYRFVKEEGKKKQKIGILYDHPEVEFPAFFIRSVFSFSSKHAEIADFYFNPEIFSKSSSEFDKIIFVSRSGREWMDQEGFAGFVLAYNARGFWPFRLAKKAEEELLDLIREYKKACGFEYYSGTIDLKKEKITVYEKSAHD